MINDINKLITYANDKNILDKRDNVFMYNKLCNLLEVELVSTYKCIDEETDIDDLLENISQKYKHFETDTEKELFKSKIIGNIMERPSNIEKTFFDLFNKSPQYATDYLYNLCKNVNYIKVKQIKKNIEYKVQSKYGEMDITINLSKPEKTTKEIELLKENTSNNWPKCFLCKEQEGYYGNMKNPDRFNHRLIKLKINKSNWYFQYSPYSYFNEHSILLSEQHNDMIINKNTFKNLISFVDMFPDYMIGSNADIPIVGGSMLTHDHYQCGRYEFPLFKSRTKKIKNINNVDVYSVDWPMHTVKIIGDDSKEVIELATHIKDKWYNYKDEKNKIFNFTDERHNALTPIVRKQGKKYEMFLILRNNLTTNEYPTGIFHVDKKRQHIKQENIGLIEAMGLAILPPRLKNELEEINTGKLKKEYTEYFRQITNKIDTSSLDNLYELVGKCFVECLEDCGVFKFDSSKYIEFIKKL